MAASDVGVSGCAACLMCTHLRCVAYRMGTLGMLVPKVWTPRATLGVWLSRVCAHWWLGVCWASVHIGHDAHK